MKRNVTAVLEARRDELAAELAALRMPVREPGVQPQYGKRVGDHTTEAVEQLTRGGTAEQLQRMADEVARALDKAADGSYGRCDGCGGPIAPERLKALPWATRCVACQASGARRAR